MRFSPSGEFDAESTASAWVWSTYLCGRIACRMVSTDGEGAQHVRVELVHHLRIGELREPGELAHVAERDRREARGLDRLEVPAAALHVEHVLFLAEQVLLAQLDRGVASAVQHERAIAAEATPRS